MIRFDCVSSGSIQNLSFNFEKGVTTKFLFDSDVRKNDFFAALVGLRRPSSGRVMLFDEDIYQLEERERLRLFKRIGVVPTDGGMISNLKGWENALLPSCHHLGVTAKDAEREVVNIFKRLDLDNSGLSRRMRELPDHLTMYEKRIVALIRAMLMKPEILIYDFLLSGLDGESANRLIELTREFHDKKAGRLSLYLCSADGPSARLTTDKSLNLAS